MSTEAPTPDPANASAQPPKRQGFLDMLGLHRPELRAWAMYDWANSAMVLVVMTAVFPIFFADVCAAAGMTQAGIEGRWGICNSFAIAIVAIFSPVLGSMADFTASRKKWLAGCVAAGVLAVGGMFFIQRGDVMFASLLFVASVCAASLSFVFYESLLPHIASQDEIDRVSTAGYALGYVGGGLLLILNLLWIQKPEWFGFPHGQGLTDAQKTLPVRVSFVSVALWWLLFSIPVLRRVPEPPRMLESDEKLGQNPAKVAIGRLKETFRELRAFKQTFLMLIAFLLYNDGINTVIRMAAIYGKSLNIGDQHLIAAILITQFVGVPFAFLFGSLAGRMGAKNGILLGLGVYIGITIFAYFITTTVHFYILAIVVGFVQGGTQALSRSLFAKMVPRHKSSEFFGFFSVFSKFAGILGPLVYAGVIAMTGESRGGILSVVVFFIVGAALLWFVNVAEGVRVARAAEEQVTGASR